MGTFVRALCRVRGRLIGIPLLLSVAMLLLVAPAVAGAAALTASVVMPADGVFYPTAAVPPIFSGFANGASGGSGLNANSTTFMLKDVIGQYWNGLAWQRSVFCLPTTHPATTGDTAATWTSTAAAMNWGFQPGGTYVVQAVARDAAGNVATGSPVSFTLQNAPLTFDDHLLTYDGTATVRISAEDVGTGPRTIHWRLDGQEWNTGSVVQVTSPGTHTLQHYATDAMGNTGEYNYPRQSTFVVRAARPGQTFQVGAVPWQGWWLEHYAYLNSPTTLTVVVNGDYVPPLTARWSFGDGLSSQELPVSDPASVTVAHTYAVLPGSLCAGSVEIRDSLGATASCDYMVRVVEQGTPIDAFDPPPVAYLTASSGGVSVQSTRSGAYPTLYVRAGDPVTFSAPHSFHLSPNHMIADFRYAFDAGPYPTQYLDGVSWQYVPFLPGSSPDGRLVHTTDQARSATYTYIWPGSYTAALRTVDDNNPPQAAQGVVCINVTQNHVPTAEDVSLSTPPDTPVEVAMSGLDSDGDSLTYSILEAPIGQLGTISGNKVTYTPPVGFRGRDSFTYKCNDGRVDSGIARVTIAVNRPPVAQDISVSTAEHVPVEVEALATDPDADPLEIRISRWTTGATISGTTLRYDPWIPGALASGFHLDASFVYSATDPYGAVATATVTVTVNGVNDPPVTVEPGRIMRTPEGVPYTSSPSELNHGDVVDGGPCTFVVTQPPTHGSVVVRSIAAPIEPQFVYTPEPGYIGVDSFEYQLDDGALRSAPARAVFEVLSTSTVIADPGGPYVVNRGDFGSYLPVSALASRAFGAGNSIVSYAWELDDEGVFDDGTESSNLLIASPPPLAGSFGSPRMRPAVRVTDSLGHAAIATTTLTVYGRNPIAAFTAPSPYVYVPSTNHVDVPLDGSSSLASDPRHPIIAWEWWEGEPEAVIGDPNVFPVNYGNYAMGETASLHFQFPVGQTFPYTRGVYLLITDAVGNRALVEKPVTFVPSPFDGAPAAHQDSYVREYGGSLIVGCPGVLTNDAGGQGALSAVLVTPPSAGDLTLNPDGSFTYSTSTHGSTSFTYKVTDGLHESDAVRVDLMERPMPLPPTAYPDSIQCVEDGSALLIPLLNDRSAPTGQAQPLSVESFDVSQGHVEELAAAVAPARWTDPADPKYAYKPVPDANGVFHFRYRLTDGRLMSDWADVTANVIPVNDAPSFYSGGDRIAVENEAVVVPGWATGISAGPVDEQASQSLHFETIADDPSLFAEQPAVDPDGALTFRASAVNAGSTTVHVRAVDDGGTEHAGVNASGWQEFTVTVAAPVTYTLTYAAGQGGTVSGITPQTVAEGGTGSPVTAVPNGGYHFVRWSDGVTAAVRADAGVTADLSVTAEFALDGPPAPIAVLDANAPFANRGRPLVFDGTGSQASDPSARIVLYEWDWDYDTPGDFTPDAVGAVIEHTFTEWGDKHVALRVTDSNGTESVLAERILAVMPVWGLKPIVDPGGPYVTAVGNSVELDGSGTSQPVHGSDIVAYEWDLTYDGISNDAVGENPRVMWSELVSRLPLALYPSAPSFPYDPFTWASLRATTAEGAISEASAPLHIYSAQPVAVPDWGPQPDVPIAPDGHATVHFDGRSSYNGDPRSAITAWTWSQGGIDMCSGRIADLDVDLASLTPEERAAGVSRTFTLTVRNSLGVDASAEFPVRFRSLASRPPNAVIAVSGTPSREASITLGFDLPLTASASSDPDVGDRIIRFDWDLDGDGTYDVDTTNTVFADQLPGMASAGRHTVVLRATDSSGVSAEERLTVNVLPATDPHRPYGQTSELTVAEDDAVSTRLLVYDPDDTVFSFQLVTAPEHGYLTLGADGAVQYEPDTDFTGSDGFAYSVRTPDNVWYPNSTAPPTTVDITVVPVQDAPRWLGPSSLTVAHGSPAILTPSVTDPDGDLTTFQVTAPPVHGTLTGPVGGAFTYTPDGGYTGADSARLAVVDANGFKSWQDVSISVQPPNHPPIANAGGPYALRSLSADLHLNGTGSADSDAPTDHIVSWDWDLDDDGMYDDASGESPVITGAEVTQFFTPAFGRTFPVALRVTDSYGAVSDVSETMIEYVENIAPSAVDHTLVTVGQEQAVEITLGAFDAEGDPLGFSIVTPPARGVLGAIAGNKVIYTGTAVGSDVFWFKANDGFADSNVAFVPIVVVATPDTTPPVAHDDTIGVTRGVLSEIRPADLLANDTDNRDHSLLTVQVVTQPAHGTLSNGANGLYYTSTAGYLGPDSFTYRAVDGDGNFSAPATVNLTLVPDTEPPVANDDAFKVANVGAQRIGPAEMLANDIDNARHEQLTAEILTQPSAGTLSEVDGSIFYTANSGFIGSDSFTYRAVDAEGNCSLPAAVVLTVKVPHDDFEDAQPISGASGNVTGSNVGATAQAAEPSGGGAKSVWYRWTAPSDGLAVFDTAGSDFDTYLGAYEGSGLPTLTALAQCDDWNGTLLSRVTFQVTAGQAYPVMVTGYNQSEGNIQLNWHIAEPPPNDAFANAAAISGASGVYAGTNADATTELGEPSIAGYVTAASVWCDWTAPADGIITFEASSTGGSSSLLGVFLGTDPGSLVSCGEALGNPARVSFRAIAGTTYHIACDSLSGTGPFGLAWSTTPPPANDAFADAIVLAGNGTLAVSNVGATHETGEPQHGGYSGDSSVWYTWTAPHTGNVRFTCSGAEFPAVFAAYTGDVVSGLQAVGSGPYTLDFAAQEGTTYRIAVDGANPSSSGYGYAYGQLTMTWYMYDNTTPIARAVPTPALPDGENGTYRTTPSVSLQTNEEATTYHSWDDPNPSSWQQASGSFAVPEGDHTLYWYAVDPFGNTSPVSSRAFRVRTSGQLLRQTSQLPKNDWRFATPFQVGWDRNDGSMWVADNGDPKTVTKYSADGRRLLTLGTSGADGGTGHFADLRGLAVDARGYVFVANADMSGRIEEYDPQGNLVLRFGDAPPEPTLDYPCSLAVDRDGHLWVADAHANAVKEFDADGNLLNYLTSPVGGPPFVSPQGVASDSLGNVYVANTGMHQVLKLTSNGTFQGFVPGGYGAPVDIAVNALGDIYVLDALSNTVTGISRFGYMMWQVGGYGSGPRQFNGPQAMHIDPNGYLVVSDTFNGRIQRLEQNGNLRDILANDPSQRLGYPGTVAVDAVGNSYVVDCDTQSIKKFSPAGDLLRQYGGPGTEPGQFVGLWAVAVAPDGKLYAADYDAKTVTVFDASGGGVLDKWPQPDPFGGISGMRFGPDGNLYAAQVDWADEVWGGRVLKLSPEGDLLADLGHYSPVQDVAVDQRGNVFVSDYDSGQIIKLAPDGREITRWSGPNGPIRNMCGIDIDMFGRLFVCDFLNGPGYSRIQVFTTDGTHLGDFGVRGTRPGQLGDDVEGVRVGPDGKVYVCDSANSLVRVYEPAEAPAQLRPTTTATFEGGWHKASVTVTLTATDPDNGSDSLTTCYRVGTDPTVRTYAQPFAVSDEGATTIEYWSVDPHGNEETPHRSAQVMVDNTPPTTTPDYQQGVAGTVTVSLNAADADSQVRETRYVLDGAAAVVGTTVKCATPGSHTLAYSSTDFAGNDEETQTIAFWVLAGPGPCNITGVVTGLAGEPLDRMVISAFDANTHSFVRGTFSDAQGRFAICGLPAGSYHVRYLSSTGTAVGAYTYYGLKSTITEATTVTVGFGGIGYASQRMATVPPSPSVAGTLTNAGVPLGNVIVAAFDAVTHSHVKGVFTNAQGVYALPLPAGSYHLRFTNTTPASLSQYYDHKGPITDATTVTVTNGPTVVSCDLAPQAKPSMVGTITNAAAPLPGIIVAAFDAVTHMHVKGVFTNAQGGYVLELPPGSYHVRFTGTTPASLSQYYDHKGAITEATTVTVGAGPVTVTSDLAPLPVLTQSITGVITNAGLGLDRIVVTAFDATTDTHVKGVFTDALGNYTLSLPPGSYHLRFTGTTPVSLSQYYDHKVTITAANVVLLPPGGTVTVSSDLAP